jgi:sulfoxide reductase heme-binding subunit YedZ
MALWYASRALGLVALLLLSSVVVLGLLVAGRRPRAPYVLTALHRSLSLLAVSLIALHVTANVVDSYVPIRWTDAVVPFVSAYRPFWLGLGAVALDVIIALVVTSLLRTRLGPRAWRAVHWLAYACWPVAVVHSLGIGTDGTLVLILTVVCGAAVLAAAVRRVAIGHAAAAPPARAVRREVLIPGGRR